jgi:predicted regulator of Ras-like GTPase activity (Roadblock/LC7/MglB family)
VTQPAVNLDFLLNDFVHRCAPHVQHAIAVSSDGITVAATRDLPVDRADQLAAFAAGLIGLVGGTARCLEAGAVISNVTELEQGFVLSMSVSTGASLLVLAGRGSDLALVSFEMAELINRVGHAITPDARFDRFAAEGLIRQ